MGLLSVGWVKMQKGRPAERQTTLVLALMVYMVATGETI